FGRIDILLNNAAIFYDMELKDQSLEYFNKILSVNLTGVWLCSRAVEPYMKRQRKGKIIHQSSTAAYIGNAGVVDTSDPDLPSPAPHYSVAKIGVSGLTKYMAGYLGPWGINVNTICPGLTMTEAAKRIVPEEMMTMLPMFNALKRALQPQDLTGTAVFLASEDSDMMTGQALVVDGGIIMLGESPVSKIDFTGHVVIVTGAGRGLGRRYAMEIARRGGSVVVNDLGGTMDGEGSDRSIADQVVAEIERAGGVAVASYDSVASPEGGKAIVRTAVDAFGRLDAVVSNAGVFNSVPFDELSQADWQRMLSVHLDGGFHLGQPAFRVMKSQGYGRFVFIASSAGLFGQPVEAH